MNNNLNITPERWSELLVSYSTTTVLPEGDGKIIKNGRTKNIHLGEKIFTDKDIFEISKEMESRSTNSDTLNIIQNAFDKFLTLQNSQLQKESISLTKRAVTFSKWASKHFVLATLISILSFGILFGVWKYGNKIIAKVKTKEDYIKEFSALKEKIDAKLSQIGKPEPSDFELANILPIGDLPGIIMDFFSEEDRLKMIQNSSQAIVEMKKRLITQKNELINQVLQCLHAENDLIDDSMKKEKGYSKEIEKLETLKKEDALDNIKLHLNYDEIEKKITNRIFKIIGLKAYDRPLGFSPLNNTVPDIENVPQKIKNLFKHQTLCLMALRKDRYFYGRLFKKFAPDEFKLDREFIFRLAAVYTDVFEYAASFKNDREIFCASVKYFGYNLQHGSEEFRNDKELVLDAVSNTGSALKYASDTLRKDPEVALEAVKATGYALEYVLLDLSQHRNIVLAAVKTSGASLKFAPQYKEDREVVEAAVSENVRALQYACEAFQQDPKIIAMGRHHLARD